MKLYREYITVIKNIGSIKKAYFTTFNMDIEFVEKYILPPLINEDIPDNKFSLEDLNLKLMSKEAPDIRIFYDVNMLTSHEKKTLIKTYPVLVENGGVFHPKVIYLVGTKGSYLFVGSGNLTISGWGRNIEAFSIVKITNTGNLYNQVLDFFDDVFALAGLDRIRKTKRAGTNDNDSMSFVYSSPIMKDNLLLESLIIDKTLQIHSPYFSDSLDVLFDKDEFRNLETISIAPDLIDNQRIRTISLPSNKKINFFRFDKKCINTEESFNHSKIWISDTKIAIGSYNCTEAALFGKNFEVALVRDYKEKNAFILQDSNKFIPDISTKNKEDKEDIPLTTFKGLYILTADYNTITFTSKYISGEKGNLILLPYMNEYIKIEELDKLTISKKLSIFRALLKNKIFKIKDKKSQIIFEGIILEINATLNNRASNTAETLDDVFLSLADEKNPTDSQRLEKHSINIDRYEEDEFKRKKSNTIVNYYSMFLGFKNLRTKLEKIKTNNEQMRSFCYTSACSVEVVKEILLKKKEEGDLFVYLTILELNNLIKDINKVNIDDIAIEPIKNIDIKFSSDDKKFISRFIK